MIPIFKPSISEVEITAVNEILRSGWWGLGQKVQEFEEKFANYVGVKYAVALNSATAALDLAVKAHEIKDEEVIVPALTFISTALAPLYNNNKIVFADINEDSLCINWEDVESKITEKTKAVIPVWYSGRYPNDIPPFTPRIRVIEDCAQA